MQKALDRQHQAYRPGTLRNRKVAIKSFIGFSVDSHFKFKTPSPEQVCAYIELLILRKMNPRSIRTHISGIKSYFINAGFDCAPFTSIVVANALRAVDISVKYDTKLKIPLSPDQVLLIMSYIDKLPNGAMISFAISLMFTAFIRQSNLLPASLKSFDIERQILCKHVTYSNNKLSIELQWSKTNQKFGESKTITAHAMPNSGICPVVRYLKTQSPQSRSKSFSIIRFKDNNPMTVGYVNRAWKQAINALKIDLPNLTLHKLRLSGASWAASKGASNLSICQQGTWSSDAFRAYVVAPPSELTEVNKTMYQISHKK